MPNIRIIIFISFSLEDRETRYLNLEKECLAIVRLLSKVKQIIQGSKFKLQLYTNHIALKGILKKGTEVTSRIQGQRDRLGEYDFKVYYRPRKSTIMGVPDGLSRMPTLYRIKAYAKDAERFEGIILSAIAPKGKSIPVVNIPLISQEEKA